jgi:hypothetical protein
MIKMKYRFLILVLISSIIVQAQQYEYLPFPDSIGLWKYRTLDQGGVWWNSEYFTRKTVGQKQLMLGERLVDPVINDTLKYYEENKRIIRVVYDTIELVLFDFNLTVGDTFYHPLAGLSSLINDKAVVVADDSVVSWYGNRRIITFDDGAKWVEGIGNIEGCMGAFEPLMVSGPGCPRFECIFSDTASFPCADAYVLSQDTENESINSTLVFPNPTTAIISVTNHESLVRIEVFDMAGRRVIRQDEQLYQADLSSLPNGLYLMMLKSKEDNKIIQVVKN